MALVAGCVGGAPEPDRPDHPLVDRIWDVRKGEFVARAALIDAAAASDHLLLGEVHVSPHHHAAQLEVLAALVARGARPAVVFEMIDRDQQSLIDGLRTDEALVPAAIDEAVGFGRRGWDWPLYQPLFALALEHGLPILAGNAPATETRRVATEGIAAIPPDQLADLGLAVPLPPAAREALRQVMEDSHCGHAIGELADRLVDAQRVRDATMADVMLAASPSRTVLIAGAGHARQDYGVPLYLARRAPGVSVLAVRLVEVREGYPDPAAYEDRVGNLPAPFDYLWFTPFVEREDPCEQFREGLERLRNRSDGGQ